MNWIGLALTALEIGYMLIKDDDLQNWCEQCAFRKVKSSKNWRGGTVIEDHFASGIKELEALENSARSIGVTS